MKFLGLLLLIGIGFLVWKVISARTEYPPWDIMIEEDEQIMRGDDWENMA